MSDKRSVGKSGCWLKIGNFIYVVAYTSSYNGYCSALDFAITSVYTVCCLQFECLLQSS